MTGPGRGTTTRSSLSIMLSKRFIEAHDGVFVVTAPGFEERQRSVVEQLGDGTFEFVFGVNKANVTLDEMIASEVYDPTRAMEFNRASKPMSLGEVCCSIGHNKVYQIMLERKLERALVFEDDVFVENFADDEIEAALGDIPADADFIYWDWSGDEHRPWFASIKEQLYLLEYRVGILKWNPTMIMNMFPRDHNRSFMVAGRHHYADAYTVTLAAAQMLLELNTPIGMPADDAVRYARMNNQLAAYLSRKRFFGQHSRGGTRSMDSMTLARD